MFGDQVASLQHAVKGGSVQTWTNKKGEVIVVKGLEFWPKLAEVAAVSKTTSEYPWPRHEMEPVSKNSCMMKPTQTRLPEKWRNPTDAQLRSLRDMASMPPFIEEVVETKTEAQIDAGL